MVFVGIALVLDLLQSLAFRGEFNDLEFEQINLLIEADGHAEAAMVAGVFKGDVEAEGLVPWVFKRTLSLVGSSLRKSRSRRRQEGIGQPFWDPIRKHLDGTDPFLLLPLKRAPSAFMGF